jgi:hypothetical protein
MMRLTTPVEDVSEAIEWSSTDGISIAVIVFANDGIDASALESYLPEDRDDYFLSLTNRVHAARKLTPEMAVDLLTDVNAHKESTAFQEVLSLNNAAKASAKLTAEAARLRKYSGNG